MLRQYKLNVREGRRVGIFINFLSYMSCRSKHVDINKDVLGKTGANVLCTTRCNDFNTIHELTQLIPYEHIMFYTINLYL